MFQKKKQDPELNESEMFFDAKEFHSTNKEVANILSNDVSSGKGGNQSQKAAAGAATLEIGGAWGEEDEIDIDTDSILDN